MRAVSKRSCPCTLYVGQKLEMLIQLPLILGYKVVKYWERTFHMVERQGEEYVLDSDSSWFTFWPSALWENGS